MTFQTPRTSLTAALAVLLLLFAGAAAADPPTRVARLSYAAGGVTFSPGNRSDLWVQARVNRPLVAGDRLWTDRNARAEVQLGNAVVRLASTTSLSVLNIDDRITQLDVRQGVAIVRVRSLASDETFEIDTPNLALAVRAPGSYRVEVDANGASTVVAVRDGGTDVYGQSNSYRLDAGQWYRFYGDDLEYESARLARLDDLDLWADARDRRLVGMIATRHVSMHMVGWEDLDEYGTWLSVPHFELGTLPQRPVGLGRSVGLDVDRRCAVGICAVPLWAVDGGRPPLVLGTRSIRVAARLRPCHGCVHRQLRANDPGIGQCSLGRVVSTRAG